MAAEATKEGLRFMVHEDFRFQHVSTLRPPILRDKSERRRSGFPRPGKRLSTRSSLS